MKLVWVLALVACHDPAPPPAAPPPPATPGPKTVKVPMFNDVAIEAGAIHLMDGGIHGVQGHTLVIPASGDAQWERRLEGMQPSGKAGSGKLALTAAETSKLHGWSDGLWDLAPKGTARFDMPIDTGVPRWVWAIVMRRGDEVRVLSGGDMSSPDGAPEPAKSALAWLVTRVDAASQAAP
jgi:hypothetical protein